VPIWVFETAAVRRPSLKVDDATHTTLPVLLAEAGKLIVDDGGEDAHKGANHHELHVAQESLSTIFGTIIHAIIALELWFGIRWSSSGGQVKELVAVVHHHVLELAKLRSEVRGLIRLTHAVNSDDGAGYEVHKMLRHAYMGLRFDQRVEVYRVWQFSVTLPDVD